MIDRIEIIAYGGSGGNGSVSFRREKFVPFGGPDGGNGGDGGDVVMMADHGKTTLSDLRRQRHYRAQNGGHGRGKEQQGKKGHTLLLKIPAGTVIHSIEGEQQVYLGDLTEEGQQLIVAKGGKGGWGNKHFATAARQVPRIAKDGGEGEVKRLVLDLKLLADVGLVGRPNVGKSTLINSVSQAKSKVGNYPFTTLEPKLGVVELGYQAFVIADIPGLIDGAHAGHGLGHDFLRHIERTRILVHVIDGATESPLSDLREINEELLLFSPSLGSKPQIVAVNKIDVPEVRQRIPEIELLFADLETIPHFISAATGEGLSELMRHSAEVLASTPLMSGSHGGQEFKVFRPRPVK